MTVLAYRTKNRARNSLTVVVRGFDEEGHLVDATA
jgi:hypothetical protein